MSAWGALYRVLTHDTVDPVDTMPSPPIQTVNRVDSVTGETERENVAPALPATAEGGTAAVATGPVDDVDRAEAEAIGKVDGAEPERRTGSGPNGEWTLADYQRNRERHLTTLPGLMAAGLLRPPSWADATAVPSPGARCSCCHGAAWWCEAEAPSGWRCARCHPSDHLAPEQVREVRA